MEELIIKKMALEERPQFLNEKIEDYALATYARGWNKGIEVYRSNIASLPTIGNSESVRAMLHRQGCELCPHCGAELRNYEGLRICFCKFCGGAIRR